VLTLFIAITAIILPARSSAQSPEDFLVQMVCVDNNNAPIFADPVTCPASRRKLQIGEPLPYHKVDMGSDGIYYQISDSFPIASADGMSRSVQTYFFTQNFNQDPLFPNQVFQYQPHGGYNILGADSNWVSYRGTSDPGSYWSPWWNASCQTQGWRLFPNNSSAFSYGNNVHGVATAPNCSGSISTVTASLEWTLYPSFPFIVDLADPSKNKYLDSLAGYHFAVDANGNFGDLEISFFTQEYGATRWEAWSRNGPASSLLTTRCPGSVYTTSFHGSTYYMKDCRNWVTLIQPSGGSWDPDGRAAANPNVLTWAVDPLYTGTNYLANTHMSGAPCSDAGWTAIHTPTPITLGWLSGLPWSAGSNCVRTLQVAATPANAYYQQISPPPTSGTPYRFGVTLWGPQLGGGTSSVNVVIIQRDAGGTIVGHDTMVANVSSVPRAFESTFARAPTASTLFFALYPQQASVEYAMTGAYITQ
jgi:hypothetical protein